MPGQSSITGTGVVAWARRTRTGSWRAAVVCVGHPAALPSFNLFRRPIRDLPVTGKLGGLYSTKEQPPRTNYFSRFGRPFLRKKPNILVPPCGMAAYLKPRCPPSHDGNVVIGLVSRTGRERDTHVVARGVERIDRRWRGIDRCRVWSNNRGLSPCCRVVADLLGSKCRRRAERERQTNRRQYSLH
jgi:hypothetical protein